MAKRFKIAPLPKGEAAKYTDNPYETQAVSWVWGQARGEDLIVRPNDELLIQKGGSEAFQIYTRLLFDETVQAAMIKMSQEITSRELKVEPAGETPGDIAVKEFIEDKLRVLQMDEVFRGLLESYICGFSVAEIMWRRTPSGVVPFDVRFRDQRRFRFQEEEEADYGFTMRIATREHPYIGEELPPRKFVVHRYWAQNNGDPYGAGLGRILYPLVKFKRRALESQLLYSDRFSNPTAIAKAPLSATAVEVDTLYDHLSNLSQETALVLPEGFDLEFVTPGGSPETFQNLRETLGKSIHLLIAGEDEAGSADAGSRASSEVAQTVRMARAKDLSELLCQTLNESLVRWMIDLNFGTNVSAPRLYRDFDPKQDVQLDMTDVATLVKDVGLRPTIEWLTERFDVELEEEDKIVPTGPEKTSGVDIPSNTAEEEGGGEMDVDGIADSVLGTTSEEGETPEPTTEEVAKTTDDNDSDIDSLINEILG